jgi:hypothetical protein
MEHDIRGKNNRSKGRRGLTLTRIMLHHHKIFGEGVQKRKEMIRTWEEQDKIGRHHYFALVGSALFKGIRNGDVPAFVIGDGMGDTPAFMIKGYVTRETCISFTCIIRDTQYEHASPFC